MTAAPDAGSDASSFCSGYTSYTFCESFDEGVPGMLTEVSPGDASSGTISPDLSTSVAPSTESLEVMLPPVDAGGASARALVGKSFPLLLGTDLLLQAQFEVAKPCLSLDGVTVAIITVGFAGASGAEYSVAVTVGATSTDVVEIFTQSSGEATLVAHAAGSALVAATWSDIKLSVHLAKKTFDLSAGTVSLFSGYPLSEEPDAGTGQATSASFAVGASATDIDAAAPACTVLVDNVLFDDTEL